MKTFAAYSLGALATLTATEALDPNSLASNGIIWNDDNTLCLMMKNSFIERKNKKNQNWEKKWQAISKSENRLQWHMKEGKTPRCEDTKVFWSSYCYDSLNDNFAGDEDKWLAEDPNVHKALFRVSIHEDLDNVFCIIPDGDYCLEDPDAGTYKLQSVGTGNRWEKFSFVGFNGVLPDYFFNFDEENNLLYGSDQFGWEIISSGGKRNHRMTVGNAHIRKGQKKRLNPVNYNALQEKTKAAELVIPAEEEASLFEQGWFKYDGPMNGKTTQLYYMPFSRGWQFEPSTATKPHLGKQTYPYAKEHCESLHPNSTFAAVTSLDEFNFLISDSFIDAWKNHPKHWYIYGYYRLGCYSQNLNPSGDPFLCEFNENLEEAQEWTGDFIPDDKWANGRDIYNRYAKNEIQSLAINIVPDSNILTDPNHLTLMTNLQLGHEYTHNFGICQIRV